MDGQDLYIPSSLETVAMETPSGPEQSPKEDPREDVLQTSPSTGRSFKKLLWSEIQTLLKLAWPVSAAYLLQMSLGLASVFSLGHLGTNELAASALATMFCNVTGFSIGIGFASALDTLCSQAFTGSNDPKALGKHLQRAFLVMLLLSLPISILWLYAENVFLVLGQDPTISALAGEFSAYMILGLFPNFVNECLKRYLQAQGGPNVFVISVNMLT
jgi:MATE family multidrug resistance protein